MTPISQDSIKSSSPSGATFAMASVEAIELKHALATVIIVGFFNAEYLRIARAIQGQGLLESLYGTFGISVIAWLAFAVAVNMTLNAPSRPLSAFAGLVLGVSSLLILLPATALSSVGLTLLGLYCIVVRPEPAFRTIGYLVVALAASTLWSRLIFNLLSTYILRFDAILVATLVNTSHSGNLIQSWDGSTTLQVGAACSSFLNVSIAFLAWVTATAYYGAGVTVRSVVFLVLSCASIIAINTIRIGLIAAMPQHFELFHGPIGASVVNVASTLAVLFLTLAGTRR